MKSDVFDRIRNAEARLGQGERIVHFCRKCREDVVPPASGGQAECGCGATWVDIDYNANKVGADNGRRMGGQFGTRVERTGAVDERRAA